MAVRFQHYLHTTRWVKAEASVKIATGFKIRNYSKREADHTARVVRNRSASARISGTRDFYYQRATALNDQTVVEIISNRQVVPTDILSRQARLAEITLVASIVLQGDRDSFLRRIVGVREEFFDLNIMKNGRQTSVSSTSQAEKAPTGLKIDDIAARRYQKNGFSTLFEVAKSNSKLSTRIQRALGWLIQSRTDKSVSSAFVKTATALETLVVIGREPTRRALSERGAYILSDSPKQRLRISRALKLFYSKRGEIVHGRDPVSGDESIRILEFGDRIAVLIALVLAANKQQWKNADDVRRYCDAVRWGEKRDCVRPWSIRYLNVALGRLP